MVLRLMNPLRHIMHRVTEEMTMDLTIFLNALAAFLPIGLFLAAIPPNLITISTKKKRSIQSNEVEQDDHQIDQEEEKA